MWTASSLKPQVRHPVSHQQVPRVQAYFQASCKCGSDQPLGCRRVLALNAKSVQLADGALHASRVPPHCAPGREDQVPESPQRERASGPVVVRARCAHSTSCAQRSARGSRRRGRGERSARSAKRTTNVLGDRPPALDGSPTSTDEQVGSLCCQVAAPASKPESLQAHAVSVLPDCVQDSRAKGVRAERSHAVACQRVGRARKRSRASLGLQAVLRPSRGAKRRAQAAARRTRRCASRCARVQACSSG